MVNSKSGVGSEALAYCTSCKMDLNHIVMAMQGDRIAKVECRTCKKAHVYKAPKGVTEPGGAAKTTGAKTAAKKRTTKKASDEPQSNPIEVEWEKLMSAHRASPTKTYTTKAHFILGDKITHPSFGDGIVSRLIFPNKVEVIFRSDVKVLIHTAQAAG